METNNTVVALSEDQVIMLRLLEYWKEVHPEIEVHRVVKGFLEMLQGYEKEPEEVAKQFTVQGTQGILIEHRGIQFTSLCPHHALPFFGLVDVAYKVSSNKVLGLSKVKRVVDIMSKRFAYQERLTSDLKSFFDKNLGTISTVRVTATHTCMRCRGITHDYKVTTKEGEHVFI